VIGVVLVAAVVLAVSQPSPEVLHEIRVQGNVLTPDEEVIKLSGAVIGAAVGPGTADEIAARLRATGRFERVEVLKRFASISDLTQIVLVIIVDEGPVSIVDGDDGPRVVRKRGIPFQVLPVLAFEDGYGLTYGARFALPVGAEGANRLSVPITWGGEKRAAAELDVGRLPGLLAAISHLQFGAAVVRRENPYYEQNDDRGRGWVRAERSFTSALRAGVSAGLEDATFADQSDRFRRLGADLVFDTRLDAMMARNAVMGRAAWERLDFDTGPTIDRTELEARAHLGLPGQSILVSRAQWKDSNEPLPPYLRPLLGGMANVRGLSAGTDIGDTLVAGSLELMLPVSSPLSVGRLGVSAFVDVAAVYDKGERLKDQRFHRGAGGAVWFSAAIVRAYLAVAHGMGSSTRLHFSMTVAF
jgi:Omp85 superfamily domain